MKWMDKVFSAFANPSGVSGYLAGKIMSARGSNIDRNRWGVEFLHIRPGDRILEFGCGPGVALDFILPLAGEVIALDRSSQMIAMAKRRHRKALEAKQLNLYVSDIFQFTENYQGDMMDCIFSSNVVQFWDNLDAGFSLIHKLLRPGGVIVTNYMSRGKSPSSEKTKAMAEEIASSLERCAYRNIRIEYLEISPVIATSIIATH